MHNLTSASLEKKIAGMPNSDIYTSGNSGPDYVKEPYFFGADQSPVEALLYPQTAMNTWIGFLRGASDHIPAASNVPYDHDFTGSNLQTLGGRSRLLGKYWEIWKTRHKKDRWIHTHFISSLVPDWIPDFFFSAFQKSDLSYTSTSIAKYVWHYWGGYNELTIESII